MYNKAQLSKDRRLAKEPKKLARPKDKFVIPGAPKVDPNGYWDPANVGRIIEVPLNEDSRSITMSYPDGTPLDQPLIGVGTDTGMTQYMMPGQDYMFPYDSSVIEHPIMDDGGTIMDLDDEEIALYKAGGYIVEDLSQQDNGGVYSKDLQYPNKRNPANSFTVTDPRSMQNGGGYEIELTDEEIEQYRKGGYVVEELPQAQNGLTTEDQNNVFYNQYLKDINDKTKYPTEESAKLMFDRRNKYYNNYLNRKLKGVSEADNLKTYNQMINCSDGQCDVILPTYKELDTPPITTPLDNSIITTQKEEPVVSPQRYMRQYNPYTQTYEPMSPQQLLELQRAKYKGEPEPQFEPILMDVVTNKVITDDQLDRYPKRIKVHGQWYDTKNKKYEEEAVPSQKKNGGLTQAQLGIIASPYNLSEDIKHPMQVSPNKPTVKRQGRTYDALTDVKPAVAESTTPKNLPNVDKNITEKAVAQKQAERKAVAKEIISNPLLNQEQKNEILMDPRKLDENVHLAYQTKPDTLKAAKEYTIMDKIENIARNPLVAATYAMQPGDFNMPMNYSEYERSPEYNDPLWNRNALGQAANFARYFTPVGLAAGAIDNAIYTGDDIEKALESGKAEDWKQAGYSGLNTILDLAGSKYIGGSGRLLNAGERATLEAMNASNRLGLNPAVNSFLGRNVYPNVSSSAIRSVDDLALSNVFPQINPMSPRYNPIARKLHNTAVSAGTAQNMSEALGTGLTNADIENTINDQINWITSEEYYKRRSANTGETYDQIFNDVNKTINNARGTKYDVNATLPNNIQGEQTPRSWPVFGAPQVKVASTAVNPPMVLKHEVGHLYSPAGFDISTSKLHRGFDNPNVANLPANKRGVYANYPSIGGDKMDEYLQLGYEQQVRHLNARDQILSKYNLDKDAPLTEDQVYDFVSNWNTKIQNRNAGFSDADSKFYYGKEEDYDDIWESERKQIIQQLKDKYDLNDPFAIAGLSKEEKQKLTEETNKLLSKKITDVLNKAWMTVPAAAAATSMGTEEKMKGGSVMNLTPEEIKLYQDAGYVVMGEGGSYVDNQMTHFQDGGNMDPGNNALELHMFYDKMKFQPGGTFQPNNIYTYKDRPGSYYKLGDEDQMLIKNEDTKWQYTPMDDPEGNRRKALEQGFESGKTKNIGLPKPDAGPFESGQIYTYEEKPGSYYKLGSSNELLIKNEGTQGKYVPMVDPKGERRKTLMKGFDSGSTKKYNQAEQTTINDFMYSKKEAESETLVARAEECLRDADGNCAASAFSYYDKYVAPKLPGGKSSWSMKESAGMSSGKEGSNPSYGKAGESWDSWDLAGGFMDAGAKLVYTAKDNNNRSINESKLMNLTEPEVEQYWRNAKLPIGTIINAGNQGLDENYGKGKSYNVTKGLAPSNHTAIVVGYDNYGTPYVYDYGGIHSLADPYALVNSLGITNIVSPKETSGYTYDKIKTNKNWNEKVSKLNLDIPNLEDISDVDEMQPFLNNLQKNKSDVMGAFGLTNEKYDEYAKIAAAIALAETGGGDDATRRGLAPGYVMDKVAPLMPAIEKVIPAARLLPTFGESAGITQINPKSVWHEEEKVIIEGEDDYFENYYDPTLYWDPKTKKGYIKKYRNQELANQLNQLGITQSNYNPWDPKHQAIVTMAMIKDAESVSKKNAANNPLVSKKLTTPELVYYQWNVPSALRTDDPDKAAQGDNENVKRFMEYYNNINKVNKQKGGSVQMMSNDQIQKYRNAGYVIIEEPED